MTRLGKTLIHALAIAGMVGGLAVATPAYADRDHDRGRRHWKQDKHWKKPHDRDYDRRTYYYRDDGRYAYRDRYDYYGPRVYVPVPAPPSFGLHLVFPFD